MTKVYESLDLPMVGHFRSILESSGMQCEIRNENTVGLAGEVPLTTVYPELWVLDDKDAPRAKAIIRDYFEQERREPAAADWVCPRCGETVDGVYAECWNCGAPAPGTE